MAPHSLNSRLSSPANRDYPRGPAPKIEDLEAFRAFAQANGHLTQQQIAQQWQGEITNCTIGKALKRGLASPVKKTEVAPRTGRSPKTSV
jgi:hypothetical protein